MSFKVLRISLPNGESRQVLVGAGYWDNKLYAVWTDGKMERSKLQTKMDLISGKPSKKKSPRKTTV